MGETIKVGYCHSKRYQPKKPGQRVIDVIKEYFIPFNERKNYLSITIIRAVSI
jgi:hypothetical protein